MTPSPLIALIALILITLVLFRGYWFSKTAQNQIEGFLFSTRQEIELIKLFPWSWEYLCSTGDYADVDIFEKAMGRQISSKERLLWLWHGSNSEREDNFIFEDVSGQISIYVYNYSGKPHFHGDTTASRGRCIRRSENIFVEKTLGEFGGRLFVDRLTTVSKLRR